MQQIQLNHGQVAVVDEKDFDHLSRYRWTFFQPNGEHRTGYASRCEDRKTIFMHRLILGARRGVMVDHIDGNGLNNTHANLRLCTNAQNTKNRQGKVGRAGFKGVYFRPGGRLDWQVKITVNYRVICLGSFSDPVLAADAYDKAAIVYFGEFAKLNFPDADRLRSGVTRG